LLHVEFLAEKRRHIPRSSLRGRRRSQKYPWKTSVECEISHRGAAIFGETYLSA
jgi:hypothetical protein